MKNFGIFLLLFALAFTACRDNIDDVTTTTTTPTPPVLENYTPTFIQANGDLTGFVINEWGEPVEGATVKLTNWTTTTDQFGHFFFTNIDMNAAGTLVQVEKEGYFSGSRRFLANAGTENRVQIELLNKEFNMAFISADGGTIEITGGGTITFSPNSIQNADGTPFDGVVRVATKFLDPSDYNTFTRMPGNLFGVDNTGEEVVLGTMGMIAAELQTQSGEPLNILEGNTATVTTPIPASLLTNAPAEIPLWSYNEEYGVWVEEGVSQLQNGNYVAQVTHFSYWNHDFKDPVIDFTAIITDEDGNPLENYQVVIGIPNSWMQGSGHTSEDGSISGLIPENYILELEILGICNEVLYSVEIGPFSGTADLGTIAIPASVLNSTTLTGELVDCDGNSIANGVVITTFNGGTIYEYVSGAPFSVTFTSCLGSGDMEVVGYNTDDLLQSDPVTAPGNTTTDLGDIDVCDVPLQNYISYSIDGGTSLLYLNAMAVDSTSETLISQYEANVSILNISFSGSDVGEYGGIGNNWVYIEDTNNNLQIFESSFSTLTITEYGNVGEPVIGTFSGTVQNWVNQIPEDVEISGEFNIIRQ